MTFRVGQRVCCVHEGRWILDPRYPWPDGCDDGAGPRRGDVVTIVSVRQDDLCPTWCWLGLAEWPKDDAFEASFFRPLTDISALRRLLTAMPTEELEEATVT